MRTSRVSLAAFVLSTLLLSVWAIGFVAADPTVCDDDIAAIQAVLDDPGERDPEVVAAAEEALVAATDDCNEGETEAGLSLLARIKANLGIGNPTGEGE